MAEQVGTTRAFNLPVDEILEFALEAIGGEFSSHKEARIARTALNLLFLDMQVRGVVPLSSLVQTQFTITSGSSENYIIPSENIEILDAVIRVSSGNPVQLNDLAMQRVNQTEWLELPAKYTKGRPTQFMVDKQRDAMSVNFWPVPDRDYTFYAWTVRKTADVTKSYQLVDTPSTYLPAIVEGLRFFMAKIRQRPLEELVYLEDQYEKTLDRAMMQDRDRTSFDVYPSLGLQLKG